MVLRPEKIEDLKLYKVARGFRRQIFQLGHFLPDKGAFNLADKMRNLALAITNNIAEGYAGKGSEAEKILYQKAQNSLLVLLDDLNLCLDEGYYREEHLEALKKEAKNLLKKLQQESAKEEKA